MNYIEFSSFTFVVDPLSDKGNKILSIQYLLNNQKSWVRPYHPYQIS